MLKLLAELTQKLCDHFKPKLSILAERFKFHRRSQNVEESIAPYIAELRRLATRCNFPRDYLDETSSNGINSWSITVLVRNTSNV